jgi:hypothetical protein
VEVVEEVKVAEYPEMNVINNNEQKSDPEKSAFEESPVEVKPFGALSTPKQIYDEKVDKIESLLIRDNLNKLFELGLVNFEENNTLLA